MEETAQAEQIRRAGLTAFLGDVAYLYVGSEDVARDLGFYMHWL